MLLMFEWQTNSDAMNGMLKETMSILCDTNWTQRMTVIFKVRMPFSAYSILRFEINKIFDQIKYTSNQIHDKGEFIETANMLKQNNSLHYNFGEGFTKVLWLKTKWLSDGCVQSIWH